MCCQLLCEICAARCHEIYVSRCTLSDDGRSLSEFDAVDRATTAPVKPVRRNWLANSINLKTSRGDQLKIRAPSKLMV